MQSIHQMKPSNMTVVINVQFSQLLNIKFLLELDFCDSGWSCRLCCYILKEYLLRLAKIQNSPHELALSFTRPHRAVYSLSVVKKSLCYYLEWLHLFIRGASSILEAKKNRVHWWLQLHQNGLFLKNLKNSMIRSYMNIRHDMSL